MALQNYESNHGRFPPSFTTDDAGRPLHSWRTLILPYIEAETLYKSIDLEKPWDDPVNKHARTKIPSLFQCPSIKLEPGYTTYLANAGEQGVLVPGTGRQSREIKDGTSNTVLLFEVNAEQAVEWMSPRDGDYLSLLKSIQASKQSHKRTLNIASADGTVTSIPDNFKASGAQLLPLFTYASEDIAKWPNQ